MNKRFYMAYGSNLHLGQMKHRCSTATVVGISKLMGYKLLFKGSPTNAYATIEPSKNGIVPIVIWELQEQDEKALDIYEGYPKFYYKENLKVTVNAQEIEAMVYIMNDKAQIGIPSSSYYNVIETGYRTFDFDVKLLEQALIFSENSLKNRVQ